MAEEHTDGDADWRAGYVDGLVVAIQALAAQGKALDEGDVTGAEAIGRVLAELEELRTSARGDTGRWRELGSVSGLMRAGQLAEAVQAELKEADVDGWVAVDYVIERIHAEAQGQLTLTDAIAESSKDSGR